jgi:hypothetical protein
LSCSEGLFGSAQLYHGALSASARCVCRYKGPGWFAYRAWNGMCYAEGSEKGSNTKYHPGSIVTHELDMEEGGGRSQADVPMLVEAPFAISVWVAKAYRPLPKLCLCCLPRLVCMSCQSCPSLWMGSVSL